MILNNFSSLIEMAMTLNIAFVAVEYVKSYTDILCEQVFNFKDFVKAKFDLCKENLVDEATLNNITPILINGVSTQNEIEKLKREREVINSEIENERKRLNDKVSSVCEVKNLSSVSLILFLYGIIALIIIGCRFITSYWCMFWLILTFGVLLYSVLAWTITDSKRPIFSFRSLRHSLVAFIIFLILSLLLALIPIPLNDDCINILWLVSSIIALVLFYSNFVVAFLKVWSHAKTIRGEILDNSEKISGKCNDLQENVSKIVGINAFSDHLLADDANREL